MEWNEINTEKELDEFCKAFDNFHDSCIKELKYISGAYVNKKLEMHPINDERRLYMIVQSQYSNVTTIEIEFSKLTELRLRPIDETYTCEILSSSMFFENGKIYWSDSEMFKNDRESYEGTWICAEKIRWRVIDEF